MWNGTSFVPLWCCFQLNFCQSRALHVEPLNFSGVFQNTYFSLNVVESSLIGSVWTESLRISPSSSDRGRYFIIKSSILMGAFTFLVFVQQWSFCGKFSSSWRDRTLYYASGFGGNVCRPFAQCWMCIFVCSQIFCTFVYGFYVRIRLLRTFLYVFCASCADLAYVYSLFFAQVMQLLHTCTDFVRVEQLLLKYTAYLLRMLCGVCLCIQLIFNMFNSDSLKGSNLAGSSISFSVQTLVIRGYSRIRSWVFHRVIFPHDLLVIIGQSLVSDIEGSVDIFVCTSCLWYTTQY